MSNRTLKPRPSGEFRFQLAINLKALLDLLSYPDSARLRAHCLHPCGTRQLAMNPPRQVTHAKKPPALGCAGGCAVTAAICGRSYSVTNRAKRLPTFSRDIFRYSIATSSNSSRTRMTFLSVLACSNLSRHDCRSKIIVGRFCRRYCHTQSFLRNQVFTVRNQDESSATP